MHILSADYFRDSTGINSITIPSQTTVYTKAHKVGHGIAFGLSALLSSVNGVPDVKVELQVSDTAPAALEGIADSVGADWCIQENGSAIFSSIADEVLHKITVNPTPAQYVRLKLTGNAGNQTDTIGVFRWITQQQLGSRG